VDPASPGATPRQVEGMRLPKGYPLRSEMRKGLDWLGRIRGKKLKNVCQSLGFRLRVWKVAGDIEKAPDPVFLPHHYCPIHELFNELLWFVLQFYSGTILR